MSKIYSNNIATIRKMRGITQEEAAKVIGISRPSYIAIEAGKKELTISQMQTLLNLFGASFDDLLAREKSSSEFVKYAAKVDKYREMIFSVIKYGAGDDGRITKNKLAKLVYLSDFIWYYITLEPMSGMIYRKLPHGPVPDVYFRILDDAVEDGIVVLEQRGNAKLYSLVEDKKIMGKLSKKELDLIKKVCAEWRDKTTNEVVEFVYKQLPWQICYENEIIPYGLITQEEPEKIYGNIILKKVCQKF